MVKSGVMSLVGLQSKQVSRSSSTQSRVGYSLTTIQKSFHLLRQLTYLTVFLLSKNYTLIRREKMLILADTSNGIPYELVPKVDVDDLVARGRFEMVTVEFPLSRRLASDVVDAVQPLLGEHGQATPMVAAKKLLVTETAGKQQAINLVIASIPEPPLPTKPAPLRSRFRLFRQYQAPGGKRIYRTNASGPFS